MATLLSFISTSLPLYTSTPPQSLRRRFAQTSFNFSPLRFAARGPRNSRILAVSSSSSAFDDFSSKQSSWSADSSKKSVLASMIQEIEPLDVTLIQKDVPPTTLDAMKRTISSMLGLLPSDRFQVFIEALWEPLSKLLVSSMMTGYTLRNAEYRLCLERNLDIHEGDLENQSPESSKTDLQGMLLDSEKIDELSDKNELSSKYQQTADDLHEDIGLKGLGEMPPEVKQYILHLQSHLSSVKKELCEVKRKSAALQMQQFVGEEKNDLLDYLRSLQPEKVAELSEPTCPELKETIHSVVHGLLATLSPKMHSKAPPLPGNTTTGMVNIGSEDCAELVENTSVHFQPHVSLTRDYLARLLFWCMLLGHHLRGLEYRMELMDLLSLTSNAENDVHGDEQVA
ncbi:MAR-binding filament-like protein 1 isoform 1 [Melia azedarach]|uniref:MAR-binding filament-like protein 1 isoform 1 n=1 Tax=Melia azedarach TaxID=155640 RepID=A0ACC1XZM9_MELAZ|nr:MAR-binding filament-like protein 1 isoform 1 [Melia azedarach]